MKPNYTVRQVQDQPNNHIITMKVYKGWEQRFLLSSDHHVDNIHCRRDLLKDHLEEAKMTGGGILSIGDLYCVMNGRYDRRRSQESMLWNHANRDDYFSQVVQFGKDFYGPYAENIILFAYGNHETAVKKNSGVDLLKDTSRFIEADTGHKIPVTGYEGWLTFKFGFSSTNFAPPFSLKYRHGSGGSSPVTRGAISQQRDMSRYHGANMIISGHIHNALMAIMPYETRSPGGKIKLNTTTHVIMPSYKDEHGIGLGGFQVEKGNSIKPVGAWWLRFFCVKPGEIRHEVTFAPAY